MSLTNLIRKADQIQLSNKTAEVDAQRAETAARKAENLERQNAKFADAFAETPKFVRIIRTQLGRGEFPFLTHRAVNYRAVEQADMGACEFMEEYVRQEREDIDSALDLSDEQIVALWGEGVSIGRLESMNPRLVANFYATGKGIGKDHDKSYVRIAHFGRVLRAAKVLDLPEVTQWAMTALDWYRKTYITNYPENQTDPLFDVLDGYDPDFKSELEFEG